MQGGLTVRPKAHNRGFAGNNETPITPSNVSNWKTTTTIIININNFVIPANADFLNNALSVFMDSNSSSQ